MADEIANLVLEHLRNMRADMASVGSEMHGEFSSVREEVHRGFSMLSQRIDALETEMRGVSYVATDRSAQFLPTSKT